MQKGELLFVFCFGKKNAELEIFPLFRLKYFLATEARSSTNIFISWERHQNERRIKKDIDRDTNLSASEKRVTFNVVSAISYEIEIHAWQLIGTAYSGLKRGIYRL
jgi:hypothetical protein